MKILEIKKRISELYLIISKKDSEWDFNKSHEEYRKYLKKERDELADLDRKLRMVSPYTLSEIPKHGNVMTLNEFKNRVRIGELDNYDGYGKYIKDDMMTDIIIYPSDIDKKSIRYELNKIIWFNK